MLSKAKIVSALNRTQAWNLRIRNIVEIRIGHCVCCETNNMHTVLIDQSRLAYYCSKCKAGIAQLVRAEARKFFPQFFKRKKKPR